VLLRAAGFGLRARLELVDWAEADVPEPLQAQFDRLADGVESANAFPQFSRGLAETQSLLVQRLLSAQSPAQRPLVIAVHDPGLWQIERDASSCYSSLCDAAFLAEQTRLCVLDAFPARDLATGGQGGPIAALPQWQLLRDPHRARMLLDLGRTTRMTYLPPGEAAVGEDDVLSFDVGPGTMLLDALASHFTEGQANYDPGGRLAVQGRRVPGLIEHWLEDPYFEKPLPRWYAIGVQPDDELNETVRMAVESGWSIRDLLCTATHLIAEAVKHSYQTHLANKPAVSEIMISGGGSQNGLLVKEATSRLPAVPVLRLSSYGLNDAILDSACVAVLGLLYVDGIPANRAAITGTNSPRVLGRLTPGSARNWQNLIQHLRSEDYEMSILRNAS
jgi:anhydro-N-acetylmuramic acid kinase